MSKKSAGRAKVKKINKIDPKANFEKYKTVEIRTLEQMVFKAKRIDNFWDIYGEYNEVRKELPTFAEVCDLQRMATKVVEDMLKIVEKFDFEFFAKPEIDDPFKDLVPNMDDVKNYDDAFRAYLTWHFIRPFADRMLQLHTLVLEDIEKANIEMEVNSISEESKDDGED